MTIQQPLTTGDEHRVLRFRPRTLERAPRSGINIQGRIPPDDASNAAEDFSRYERGPEAPDDYRHRMLTNLAAMAFAIILTVIGIWLADSLADLRQTQDCILSGRRDCAHINIPPPMDYR